MPRTKKIIQLDDEVKVVKKRKTIRAKSLLKYLIKAATAANLSPINLADPLSQRRAAPPAAEKSNAGFWYSNTSSRLT